MMVGGDVADVTIGANAGDGRVLIETRRLSLPARTPFAVSLKDIDLTVHSGEVVAIAGVAGNGQSELFDALSGEVTTSRADAVRLAGQDVGRKGITERRLLGCGFVPEERHGHGAVSQMKLSDNMVLARHASDAKTFLGGGLGLLKRDAVWAATERVIKAMDVRKSGVDPHASALSGGNLQKFIMGRELDRNLSVLIVNQPTWGVDAGAASRIRQAIVDLAKSGAAVVVISQDLDEVFEIAHSIAVIHHGRLSASEPARTLTRERIGLLMGGAAPEADTVPEAAHAH
jgi:general nucleoside transport system ATP-binding protein